MADKWGPNPAWLGLAAGLLACLASAGCFWEESCRLSADTALAGGEFSAQRVQWAYDGEPVTFELECAAGPGHFALFSVGGQDFVVETPHAAGCYRWTHAFTCGAEPRTYQVSATPYLMRGKIDWVYNSSTETWDYYPGSTNRPDVRVGSERKMTIKCYRTPVRVEFKATHGQPVDVALTLTKDTGETAKHRIAGGREARPGVALAGPDAAGMCEAAYVPTHTEVSRAGMTHARFEVEYQAGEKEVFEQDVATP